MKEATSLEKYLKNKPELVKINVNGFIDEMKTLNVSEETRFILLGTEESILGKYDKKEFKKHFQENPVIYHRHYSSRGTDKQWVESMWKTLEIHADIEQELEKYKIK